MDLFAYIDHTEPDSPTSGTPASGSIPPLEYPPPRSSAQLKELGRSVYKDVWDEFYAWEPGYCAEILGTVTQTILASERKVARVAKAMVTRLVEDAQDRARGKTEDGTEDVVMSVTHFASGRDGDAHRRTTYASIPVITTDAYPPHPPYESCTPASRSILADVTHEETLQFVPYADDDHFRAQAYQTKFDTLEWATPFDPDVEMIELEAVRRLQTMHDVDIHDIDRMGIFTRSRMEHNSGLLWACSQRDVLHWPGAFRFQDMQEEQPPAPVRTPDPNDLSQRLMSNLKIFCPSINCLHSLCGTHGRRHANSHVPSKKPQITAQDMILSEGVPCSSNCFRHIQDFDQFMETLPSSSHHTGSMDTLGTIIGIAPDLSPCQLAIICLKPCKQVFVQRLQLFPDHMILPPIPPDMPDGSLADVDTEGEYGQLQHRRRTRERLRFVDTASISSYELPEACAHPGSCTGNHCPCHVKKQHCSLMCRCGVKCVRQWSSCNCVNGKCSPETCSCARSDRECIPGICINCNARGNAGRPCTNTKIQCLTSRPVEIKWGKHGWGAFACQNMHKNTFLGTYVGHILTNQLADPMADLAKYTTYNYLFEVTPDNADVQLPVFDAAHLGNVTRFFNHMTGGRDNVIAKTMVVIGEHQIGFFTSKKVKAGEELFLDYGPNYWKESDQHES